MSYKLKLEIFEGPLDLLLYLIKKDQINIYDIPIAQVTQQYMEYLEMLKMMDLDVVGDFLVMAATLLQIKSRMLLPPDPNAQPEEEEDPRDELVRRLLEYKKFKEIAEELKNKETMRQDLFARVINVERSKEMKEDAKETYFEVSLFDLIAAFSKILKNVPKDVFYEVIKDEHTVEQKIHDLLHMLLAKPRILLTELFGRARNKMEVVVTFMAILELIRLKEILVVQARVFGDIEVVRNKENIVPAQASEEEAEGSSQDNDQNSRSSGQN